MNFNITKEQVDDIYKKYTIPNTTIPNRKNSTIVVRAALDWPIYNNLVRSRKSEGVIPYIHIIKQSLSDTMHIVSTHNKLSELDVKYDHLNEFMSRESVKKTLETKIRSTPCVSITLKNMMMS